VHEKRCRVYGAGGHVFIVVHRVGETEKR
jgi:hypothetical protein